MKFVRWCIENTVPINLVIIIFAILGIRSSFDLKREAFPEFTVDVVEVVLTTEGSFSPDLIDKNVVEVIQPLIDSVDGISKVTSSAARNRASFFLEIAEGYNADEVKSEVEDEISSSSNLPPEVESPRISVLKIDREGLRLAVWGKHASRYELFKEASKLKNLLKVKKVAQQVRWMQNNQFELTIEVAPEILQAKKISYAQLANQIRNYTIETGAGEILSKQASIFLKGLGRRVEAEEFLNLPIIVGNGEEIPLRQLTGENGIQLAFKEESPLYSFNGFPAAILVVESAEDEDLISVADAVKEFIKTAPIAEGMYITPFADSSTLVKDRLNLIVSNGYIGALLILIILSLFLNSRTALWVTVGVVLSLLGSMIVLHLMGQTLNMISLFSLLITCGIIVDDAIVMGESYALYRLQGSSPKRAAIQAYQEMHIPILAMMSTTIVAFLPLFFVDGVMGKFISVMPIAIIAALAFSMLESLYILPAHLAHSSEGSPFRWPLAKKFIVHPLRHTQKKLSALLRGLLKSFLIPCTWFCYYQRYAIFILFTSILILLAGLTVGGVIHTSLFPTADSEFIFVKAKLEEGVPLSQSEHVATILNESLQQTMQKYAKEGYGETVETFYVEIGKPRPNECSVEIQLLSAEKGRKVSGDAFMDTWRKQIPPIPRLRALEFGSKQAGPQGKPLAVQLSSSDSATLSAAEKEVLEYLKDLTGAVDVGSSNTPGLPSVEIGIRDGYANIGYTEGELLESIRHAFQGITIDQFYVEQSEVDVLLRIPKERRASLSEVQEFLLPNGMPVKQIASVSPSFTASTIQRINGQRAVEVYAEISPAYESKSSDLRRQFYGTFIPELAKRYPELQWSLAGETEDAQKSVKSLIAGYFPAILIIYLILATIFRSYLQPIIIMGVIPFGFVGAILGHIFLGIPFNLMSSFGLIALTGVVVNDSLVLVDYVNKLIDRGIHLEKALLLAVRRRFRPILLTSITTIAGLAPILFETSFQAQFLIPMAATIVFGLAASTFLIFFLVPAGYAIYQDLCRLRIK